MLLNPHGLISVGKKPLCKNNLLSLHVLWKSKVIILITLSTLRPCITRLELEKESRKKMIYLFSPFLNSKILPISPLKTLTKIPKTVKLKTLSVCNLVKKSLMTPAVTCLLPSSTFSLPKALKTLQLFSWTRWKWPTDSTSTTTMMPRSRWLLEKPSILKIPHSSSPRLHRSKMEKLLTIPRRPKDLLENCENHFTQI